MIRTLIKTATLATLLGGAIYVGEMTKPLQKITNFVKFYNVSAEENTPQDYWNWEMKTEVENGKAVLYVGNKTTKEYKQFTNKFMEPTWGEKIDSFIERNIQKSPWLENYKRELRTFGKNIEQQFN